MMDKWISLEKDRVKLLLENYTFDNVLLVYPMVKSKNNAILIKIEAIVIRKNSL